MRVFFAVPVPAVDPASGETDHLTLRFLPDIPEVTVRVLEARVGPAVADVPRFDIDVEGIGAFPSPDRPRVVWRGIGAGRELLAHLAQTVRRSVVEAGVPDDPVPFSPHVTLFRVRSPRDYARARAWLDGQTPLPRPTRVSVVEVEFIESTLTAARAIHRVRSRFPLRPTPI